MRQHLVADKVSVVDGKILPAVIYDDIANVGNIIEAKAYSVKLHQFPDTVCLVRYS
jgi:hypothetical protein